MEEILLDKAVPWEISALLSGERMKPRQAERAVTHSAAGCGTLRTGMNSAAMRQRQCHLSQQRNRLVPHVCN
jgi:hypothetical protein